MKNHFAEVKNIYRVNPDKTIIRVSERQADNPKLGYR